MTELWKSAPGFDYYEVSNLGRVRSKGKPYHPGRILKPGVMKRGYLIVALSADGKLHSRSVHRLVLEAFVELKPHGHECGHLDGDRKNNALSNLAWVTPKENAAHRKIHGTHQVGEQSSNAKLTLIQVREVLESSGNQRILAEKLGVNQSTISNIRTRRTWQHA